MQHLGLGEIGRHWQIKKDYDIVTKVMQEEREDFRKQLEKMDELEEEENSPSISVMSNLACKKSQPKRDEQPTHDSSEMNSSKGINEMMV